MAPRTLKNITLSTTLACNEGCAHCWVSAGPALQDEMSVAELISVLCQARRMGAEHVKFTGGEPLTRREFPQLIANAHELGFRVSLETNGLLLRRPLLSTLSRSDMSPHFYVSIDGATSATHDKFRRRLGALQTTITNLKLARDEGFYFSIHTVVRKENVSELPAIHELARSLGASQHKLILSVHNLGRGKTSQDEAITPDEIFTVLDQLPAQEFWDYGWNPEPTRDTRLMTTLPPAFQQEGTPITTCGWSQSFLSVLADGSVALCHGLYDVEQAIAGNVRTQSLEAIWNDSALYTTTSALAATELDGVCGNCKVNVDCRGLCRANAIGEYGSLTAPYPMCQSFYEDGLFPREMLFDPELECSYP